MRPIVLASAIILAILPSLASATDNVTPAAAGTTGAPPNAIDALFEQPQMKNTTPGSTLKYDYLRRSGINKGPYGPPINDEIVLKIAAGKAADSRDIQVQMFSGGNRVPAGPFEDMGGNPILPLFLENHLKGVAGLLGGNPRYIKNGIRKGLRDKAAITPIQVDYKGKKVDGWQIVTKPFEGDPQTDKMRGLDTLTYTFVTSPEVPGEIVSIEAKATKPDGGELLEEKISYDQNAG